MIFLYTDELHVEAEDGSSWVCGNSECISQESCLKKWPEDELQDDRRNHKSKAHNECGIHLTMELRLK